MYFERYVFQSLRDIYEATGKDQYLDRGFDRFRAIGRKAAANKTPVRGQGIPYPTYGDHHSQIDDLEFCAGLVYWAGTPGLSPTAKHEAIASVWDIIGKWITYYGQIQQAIHGDALLALDKFIEQSRDKREIFAYICHVLADTSFAPQASVYSTVLENQVRQWAHALADVYLNEHTGTPYEGLCGPDNGLVYEMSSAGEGAIWRWALNWKQPAELSVMDTNHANRTVWLACEVGNQRAIAAMRHTLLAWMWQPGKGLRDPERRLGYITNYIDGGDTEVQGLGPGRKGNIWFGWHRLAEHDADIRRLLKMLVLWPRWPAGAQNAGPLSEICLTAYVARLLKEDGEA